MLSNFALGPSWARDAGKPARAPKSDDAKDERPPRRDDRRDDRQQGFRDRDQRGDGRRNFRDDRGGGGGGGGRRPYQDRRGGPPQREDIAPAPGVRVTISPDAQAVHLIGKEVHQVARVYPLFDVAQILLAERARLKAVFETEESKPAFFAGKLDESLFLTREEALRHLWQSDLRSQLLEEETVEVEPPTGNFQSVARCGLSGEWLGPPNFHSYQTNLRRLHRERFSNMPFEAYSAKVRTERGEEAVNAWLETTKQKIRWRLKDAGGETPWIDDRGDAERALSMTAFDKAFRETRKAEVSAAIPGKNLSPALLASLRIAGSHARKHPAILIPAVCRALEAEHLPVFKRQGKLHTGPARPHALAADAVLAERPGKMVAWIRENKPAKLAGLWESVLPEGSTAPPAEYAADLFWLLQQGHILLYTDDTLVVQEVREPTPPKEPKKKKAKGPKAPKAEGEAGAQAAGAASAADTAEAAGASASADEEAAPEAEELLQEPVALETPEVAEAEQSALDSAEPEASAEEASGTEGDGEKLPDSDFAEPSEAPQQPEPENTAEALPDSDFTEPSEAPQQPEPESDDSEKLPDADFAEPSEEPQKPE
ncbi:hypothetical protein OVA24_05925 [Luteolibacter sp. SL250]|uniref:hypothetical protein n=1 Tax=Luteolibacter sp. SL250 TaxID=2995170 RepID=UPI0022709284|nr:hypothetical protein [Luteolibacter sp. SL250]WAC20917.1 hypothetical protein OVA24_05925 [Luteolibacter sp. SL250]